VWCGEVRMRHVQARLLGVTARVLAHCSGEVL